MPFILPCICGSIKSELMQAFTCLTAVAAPIDIANIDTDRIIPARFLRKPKGVPGYASFLFRDVRCRRLGEAGVRPEPDALPRGKDPRRGGEPRLRLLAGDGGVGARSLRDPLGDRAEPGRHLSSELLQERPLAGDLACQYRRRVPAAAPRASGGDDHRGPRLADRDSAQRYAPPL